MVLAIENDHRENLLLGSKPSPSPALWKAGVTLGQSLGGHRVMGTATTSKPPAAAPAAPKAMPQGWCKTPKRSNKGIGAGLAVPPETRVAKSVTIIAQHPKEVALLQHTLTRSL